MKLLIFIMLVSCFVSCSTPNKYKNCPVVDNLNSKIEIHG